MPWSPDRIAAAFWKRVAPTDGCWIWQGVIQGNGYGNFYIGYYKMGSAHRISYEIHKGAIPDGYQIDHLCRVRACVNPEHLEAVTPRVNTLRSTSVTAQNAAKTHCIAGHSLNGDNLRIDRIGKRVCKQCRLDRQRAAFIPVQDGIGYGGHSKARTHCPHGHPYDEGNTYYSPTGYGDGQRRSCKECNRQRSRSRRATLRAVEASNA